ncbi:hypothetical protein J6590_056066 [Homalodisca vitripennis]|nr:hypothetical protein J6590_056066 [Homalodisca vitripennis]
MTRCHSEIISNRFEQPYYKLTVLKISASGPTKVVLRDVQKALSGRYRCEVSADAPNFHTRVVSTNMHVIHNLEGEPRILLEKLRYSVGDTLKGNCTAPPSSPPANITWVVNGHKALPKSIRHIIWRNGFDEDSKSMTIADLEFEVDVNVVPGSGGKLEVRCIADVYQAYATETKVVLSEERPRLASVLGSRDSSLGKDGTKVVGGGTAQSVAVFSLVNFGHQSSIRAAQKTFACANSRVVIKLVD